MRKGIAYWESLYLAVGKASVNFSSIAFQSMENASYHIWSIDNLWLECYTCYYTASYARLTVQMASGGYALSDSAA